jgi:hypothetical protein
VVRRVLLPVLVLCAAAAFAGSARAARPVGFVHAVTSTHFVVHYTSDPLDPAYATQGEASALAAFAEHAYAAETGWGAPSPIDDGDGKVDIYLEDLSALDGVIAYAQPDTATTTSSAYIVFGVAFLDTAQEAEDIAHELYHVIQFATWANPQNADLWLFEGSAQWAAAKVNGFPSDLAEGVGPSDLSLDCRDNIDGFQMCDPQTYVDGGYSRWPFFQSLAARFGPTFLQSVLTRGATGQSATAALQGAIGASGGTLADVYNDWAVQQVSGGYGIDTLDALTPATAATVATGVATTKLAPVTVSVDHLATRYVKFTRGDGAADHACYAATLTLSVTIAAGVTSRPFFYWRQKGNAPVPLAVNGSTATASLPWDTCFWGSTAGYLILPNDTTAVDAADFVVSSSLTVDPNTPASATAPPSQGTIYGGQTTVPNGDAAPSIEVFGPLVVQVSSSNPVLRLIVESTGDGKVHATLGTVDLGSPAVRAGNNDLRLTIPRSLLTSLRRSSSAANVLTLTPVSASGAVTGTAITRNVAVAPTLKHKQKPKKH